MTNPINASGTYLLMIHCKIPQNLSIGKLGELHFLAGYYIYVGSAMNHQLCNRVLRHCKPPNMKKHHWHIDYFLESDSIKIQRIFLIPSHERLECDIAQQLKILAKEGINKFGATDCACQSHLLYFGSKPPF